MSISFQRLIIILFSLILLTGAALLILYNSKQNLVFFYTPTEFLVSEKKMVKK
jgi:Cytochrome c-type biogenesis protein CcmE